MTSKYTTKSPLGESHSMRVGVVGKNRMRSLRCVASLTYHILMFANQGAILQCSPSGTSVHIFALVVVVVGGGGGVSVSNA